VRVTTIGQDLVGTLCDLRQGVVDIGQVVVPGRGQDQLALTIKKLDIEPFFERFDAVTNRARCYFSSSAASLKLPQRATVAKSRKLLSGGSFGTMSRRSERSPVYSPL
jgi:hypothetical protein